MEMMNNIDDVNLDGIKLTTYLTVLKEVPVSGAAADRLELTQSAVSHTFDKFSLISIPFQQRDLWAS